MCWFVILALVSAVGQPGDGDRSTAALPVEQAILQRLAHEGLDEYRSTVAMPGEQAIRRVAHVARTSAAVTPLLSTEGTRVPGEAFRGPPSQSIGHSQSQAHAATNVLGHFSGEIDRHYRIVGNVRDLPLAIEQEKAQIPLNVERPYGAYIYSPSLGYPSEGYPLAYVAEVGKTYLHPRGYVYIGNGIIKGTHVDPEAARQALARDRVQSALDANAAETQRRDAHYREIQRGADQERADRAARDRGDREFAGYEHTRAALDANAAETQRRDAHYREIQRGADQERADRAAREAREQQALERVREREGARHIEQIMADRQREQAEIDKLHEDAERQRVLERQGREPGQNGLGDRPDKSFGGGDRDRENAGGERHERMTREGKNVA